MAGDILGISTSGALAAQRALATTGHNIANANTEGYSRQQVELDARPPQMKGNGAVGTGVQVSNVRRMYDDFVTREVRDNTSVSSELDTHYHYTSQVDNLLADPKAGLAPAIQSFFAAVNGVADDPQSTSARQVLMSEAKSLADRFDYLNNRFASLREGVTADMKSTVSRINDLASAIARVNDMIVKAREVGGRQPNDLLDQRDGLIRDLSRLVSVRVMEQDDGRVNVFVGNGQGLVIGSDHAKLEVQVSRFDPDESEIAFIGNGASSIVTRFLTGGHLGGLLDFRRQILDSAQNELGRIAIGMAETFNAQHRKGMDLHSRLGGDFFAPLAKIIPKVLPHFDNKGDTILGAEITDIDKLTTSDYTLSYNNGKYRLVRNSDEALIGTWDKLPAEVESEGFRLFVDSGTRIEEGDKFIIRPTRAGAENFRPVIEDVSQIAAASPLRTEAAIDNIGDGKIGPAQVVDVNNPVFDHARDSLNPPFVIRFLDETHFEVLDNTGKPIHFRTAAVPPSSGITAEAEGKAVPKAHDGEGKAPALTTVLSYDPKTGTDVFPTPGGDDFGFRVRISGNPKAGDQFRIDFNTDGTGDNRNALALSNLQAAPVLANGTTSYTEAYSQLVSRVGSKTHELDVNGKAQRLLLQQSEEQASEIGGVNLDEEAANLVRYQNLYQANAQVISVANKMLETLMNAFR